MDAIKKTKQRSKELNELLSSYPSWTIRWGTSIVIGILLCCFIVLFFIKHPNERSKGNKNINYAIEERSLFDIIFQSSLDSK